MPSQPSSPDYSTALAQLGRTSEENDVLRGLHQTLAENILVLYQQIGPVIVGIAGSQGSGKSTHSALLKTLLEQEYSLTTCILSLDDVYLTKKQRHALSEEVHPLLATRGVPGTHDIALANATLDALCKADASQTMTLPRFDKATDDRFAQSEWPKIDGPVSVVLFEGWCIGAKPQAPETLDSPLNKLEADEDPNGQWRRYVNEALATTYSELFERLDMLIMLAAPSFEVVFEWRQKQEDALRAATQPGHGSEIMDKTALERFIMHYERITRAMLRELPAEADCAVQLSENQQPHTISWHDGS